MLQAVRRSNRFFDSNLPQAQSCFSPTRIRPGSEIEWLAIEEIRVAGQYLDDGLSS